MLGTIMRGLHEWTAIMARAERIPTVCDSDGQTQILTHFAGLQILTLPNLLNYWNSPCSLYTRLSRWRWRAPTVREKRVRPSWLLFWGATNFDVYERVDPWLDRTWGLIWAECVLSMWLSSHFWPWPSWPWSRPTFATLLTWVNNLKAQLIFQ